MELLPAYASEIVILVCAFIGIAFSLFLLRGPCDIDDEEQPPTTAQLLFKDRYTTITEHVSKGVTAFLVMECRLVAIFMVGFAMLIFLLLGYVERFSTHSRPCDFAIAVSFLLGALTSAFSGFLGVKITLYASAWTGLKKKNGRFRNGAAMGFLLAAIGLLGLNIAIITFKLYYGNDWEGLFEAITAYGLGASSMAFFERTGGGIYAMAADVCHRVLDDHPPDFRQDTVITYNVGDIVGDIAGTGTDLFGSYAQSSCAALAVASISSFGIDHDFTAMCYPLLISSMGILVCLITTLFATYFLEITDTKEINHALEKQLYISTILMSGGIVILNWIALPSLFKIDDSKSGKDVKNWQLSLCVGVGLWAGPIIWSFPKYYISGDISSLRDVIAERGAGILASGYGVLSCIFIPVYADISIAVSFSLAATYGIAVAALGMLSTIPTRLAIDAYEPIRRYVDRIVQMASENLDTDAPTATGKGFTIESTALVSIALFGAFARRAKVSFGFWDFQTLEVAVGFILGNLLPHVFSDMTMRSVGRAGLKMAREYKYKHAEYIKFPTDEFLRGLIRPGALVMLTPVIMGTFFGADALFGVLIGSLSSVLLITVSPSNKEDGALNKAIKSIRDGALEYVTTHFPSELKLQNDAYRVGKVDRPQKDASIPPLNILVQLMALESLVLAPFFASHGGLLLKFLLGGDRATSPL